VGGAGRLARALAADAPFRRRLFGLLRALFRAIEIKGLRLRGRLGLDDPADTGRLWGYLGGLYFSVGGASRIDMQIEPDFTGAVLALQGAGEIRFVPLQLIGIVLGFVFSPATVRAVRVAWTQRSA
jgi:hypothetical protein